VLQAITSTGLRVYQNWRNKEECVGLSVLEIENNKKIT
jgi:hypothetical protein